MLWQRSLPFGFLAEEGLLDHLLGLGRGRGLGCLVLLVRSVHQLLGVNILAIEVLLDKIDE